MKQNVRVQGMMHRGKFHTDGAGIVVAGWPLVAMRAACKWPSQGQR